MSHTSKSLFDDLGQRDARAPAESTQYSYTQRDSRPVSQSFPSPDGKGIGARTPLSHPVADKLKGQPVAEQIKLVMVDRCRFLGQFPARRVMQDRCERIITAYSELRTMGYQITDVTTFGLKHARALLDSWKSRGLAKKTIYNRWGTLRSWAIVIGKPGMLGSIDQYWPDFNLPAAQTSGHRVLLAEQLQARSGYLKTQSDKTAYLVDRLAREVGMVREAALEIELMAAQGIALGHDILRCGNGASVRIYKNMREHRELLQEVVEFMSSRKRTKLAWPGLTSYDAVTKYRDRMFYVTRKMFPKHGQKGVEQ